MTSPEEGENDSQINLSDFEMDFSEAARPPS